MSFLCDGPGCYEEVWQPGRACEICWAYRTTLRDSLPRVWMATHALLMPGAGRCADALGHISLTRVGSAAPLRMDALDALECAVQLVVYWTDVLAAEGLSVPLPGDARDGWLIDHGVARLTACDFHFEPTPYSGAYIFALTRMHQRFRRVADPASSPLHLHIACPHCGRLTLVQRNADHYVSCLTCSATWSEARWSVAVADIGLSRSNLTRSVRAATRIRPSSHGRKRL